jgi:hypothetical protein
MTYATRHTGVDIVYRLASGAQTAVRLIISDAAGPKMANTGDYLLSMTVHRPPYKAARGGGDVGFAFWEDEKPIRLGGTYRKRRGRGKWQFAD